jgi:hypothetical protein
VLDVRIEPKGPAAERGIAQLCADGSATRDLMAFPGAAATAAPADGERALALLVQASKMSLDDTDLHITLHRR